MRTTILRRTGARLLPGLLPVAAGILLLQGCLKDRITETYRIYTPVYTLKATVLAQINGNPAEAVSQAGQLYVKGNYIYLNDVNEGIHVYDNSDASHPHQVAWLNIPGNKNIAIKGNILYADMYQDLLALDISDPHQAKVIGSLPGFFSSRNYGDPNMVLTSWNIHDTTFRVRPTDMYSIPGTQMYTFYGAAVPAAFETLNAGSGGTGIGGSTAVMTLIGNDIFAIPEEHSLGVIDISDPTQPKKLYEGSAGYDLETIFPLQDKLLLGSKEGVYIYSIADPANPTRVTEFVHGTACDPVIADATNAYVTLHAGTSCGGSANELDVLDAKNLSYTPLVRSYPMTSPTGLCKDGSLLFVCDGTVVKVFDATDPANLQLLSSAQAGNPMDVIAYDHHLLVVSADGLYQFGYSDPSHLVQLSYLPVNPSKS
ncbi:MAG TPA: hypothetical protein VN616_04675 [Puia sp.]|nr:hypothetical protein [Puia sp.]